MYKYNMIIDNKLYYNNKNKLLSLGCYYIHAWHLERICIQWVCRIERTTSINAIFNYS